MIQTNIRIGKYSNIFEYPNIRHTLIVTMTLLPQMLPISSQSLNGAIRVKLGFQGPVHL